MCRKLGPNFANLGIFPKGSSDTEALLKLACPLRSLAWKKTLDMLIGMLFALRSGTDLKQACAGP